MGKFDMRRLRAKIQKKEILKKKKFASREI